MQSLLPTVATLSLTAASFAGCDRPSPEEAYIKSLPQVTPGQILQDPAKFVGEEVAITGDITFMENRSRRAPEGSPSFIVSDDEGRVHRVTSDHYEIWSLITHPESPDSSIRVVSAIRPYKNYGTVGGIVIHDTSDNSFYLQQIAVLFVEVEPANKKSE